jgi:hypothetical protein
MQHSAELIFVGEYLCEYESIFKTVLAHESVDPRVLFDAERSTISWDCLFKYGWNDYSIVKDICVAGIEAGNLVGILGLV